MEDKGSEADCVFGKQPKEAGLREWREGEERKPFKGHYQGHCQEQGGIDSARFSEKHEK